LLDNNQRFCILLSEETKVEEINLRDLTVKIMTRENILESYIANEEKARRMADAEATYRGLAWSAKTTGLSDLADEYLNRAGEKAAKEAAGWEEEKKQIEARVRVIMDKILKVIEEGPDALDNIKIDLQNSSDTEVLNKLTALLLPNSFVHRWDKAIVMQDGTHESLYYRLLPLTLVRGRLVS
jgi:hypothetical protein